MISASKIASRFLLASLVDHAKAELKRAGLFDVDSDYDGLLGRSVLELIEVFAKQGHSGASATIVQDLFNKLSQFKTLTPLTSDPTEWNDVSSMMGKPSWQSNRDPSVFSENGGQTWKKLACRYLLSKEYRSIQDVKPIAEELVEKLKHLGASKVEIAGSIRRKESSVGDIDIVAVSGKSPGSLLHDAGATISQHGSERAFGHYKDVWINLWVTPPEAWGAMLFYATGPQKYTIGYRMKAKRKGWLLNQKGLFDENGKRIAGETEESIYKALDKSYKEPELRGR